MVTPCPPNLLLPRQAPREDVLTLPSRMVDIHLHPGLPAPMVMHLLAQMAAAAADDKLSGLVNVLTMAATDALVAATAAAALAAAAAAFGMAPAPGLLPADVGAAEHMAVGAAASSGERKKRSRWDEDKPRPRKARGSAAAGAEEQQQQQQYGGADPMDWQQGAAPAAAAGQAVAGESMGCLMGAATACHGSITAAGSKQRVYSISLLSLPLHLLTHSNFSRALPCAFSPQVGGTASIRAPYHAGDCSGFRLQHEATSCLW